MCKSSFEQLCDDLGINGDPQYKAESASIELTECLLEIDQSRKTYLIVMAIEFLVNKAINAGGGLK